MQPTGYEWNLKEGGTPMNEQFPRCPECGGRVELTAGEGRTRELVRGRFVAIPSDFRIPTCTDCGEESMVADISEKLDALLWRELRAESKAP
jgi:hypothetical protein